MSVLTESDNALVIVQVTSGLFINPTLKKIYFLAVEKNNHHEGVVVVTSEAMDNLNYSESIYERIKRLDDAGLFTGAILECYGNIVTLGQRDESIVRSVNAKLIRQSGGWHPIALGTDTIDPGTPEPAENENKLLIVQVTSRLFVNSASKKVYFMAVEKNNHQEGVVAINTEAMGNPHYSSTIYDRFTRLEEACLFVGAILEVYGTIITLGHQDGSQVRVMNAKLIRQPAGWHPIALGTATIDPWNPNIIHFASDNAGNEGGGDSDSHEDSVGDGDVGGDVVVGDFIEGAGWD
ncbi:hypothetical protein BGX26_004504 [Mortierella sp. AD094]|nr:hypothetical protein BGX26_004504 [Mortierella sp. AD094]